MKQLILIRHSKSSWDVPILDYDRDLTINGIQNSVKVAKFSKEYVKQNSTIWTSFAKRAHKTAIIFIENWGYDVNLIEVKKQLYTFDAYKLEEIVKSCPNHVENLILFGHNNAITDFVNKFGDIYIENVPTSGFVLIIFDTNNWANFKKGTTDKIIFPRDI